MSKKTNIQQETSKRDTLTRRDFISKSLKTSAAAFTTGLLPNLAASVCQRYNVLLIIVDDLRPLLGSYGHTEMHTPNIDRIAEKGTVFNQAYCQYPLCSPSRTTIFTGLRPDTINVTNNQVFYRDVHPDTVTLPQHFKAHGYHTQSIGKVAHLPRFQDDEYSWSVPSWRPLYIPYDAATTPSWQALDVDDDELRDGQNARRTIQTLKEIKNQQFFLSIGFYKPHLPYHAPRKYFDLYENTTFNLPAISEEVSSEITPPHWNALRAFQDVPSGILPIPHKKILELTRAYAAVTSYTDAQIGRVLDQLDKLGLSDNTIIAFCGDHGYNLAENGNWGKNIIHEASLHSPLIVSIPGQTATGTKTDALVEFVDIFPTLADSCQLPILPELEGLSMLPVIEEPTLAWKTAAFSQFKKTQAIRTDQYRYSETETKKELYDYGTDPFSEVNIAELPENAELVNHLSERLHAGWTNALPEVIPQVSIPINLPWDVNNDGIVDMQDLLVVSESFHKKPIDNSKADVNNDGVVNIIDLLIVAAHFDECTISSAPSANSEVTLEHLDILDKWLTEARKVDLTDNVLRKGIAVLESLTNTVIPIKTVLLPNYPNPFNPETWIPYDLAQDTNVTIKIYSLKGEIIRNLDLGFLSAGTYRTKTQAAYWDGRNSDGEPVSSGVYFYTLQTPHMKSTRKMVIAK